MVQGKHQLAVHKHVTAFCLRTSINKYSGQKSSGFKYDLNLFFLCSQRYKFSGFTLGGLFLHPAHNESVFLIIIKKDPTKGMFIVKLQGTGY